MVWCIIALVLFVLEMFTGTFYLLIISASMFSASLSEWLFHTSTITNNLIAATLSIIGILIVRLWQRKHPHSNASSPTDDTDYGKIVRLIKPISADLWQVSYRGTIWQACFEQSEKMESGDTAQIIGHQGNILILTSSAHFLKGNNS
ncbi:NfeD family protein [Snodgrassella sp. B3882]|uniref:NfeD family protein n=1 Tax=Snodgrassella sp. B3882 TaxID=2818037 RepID=UPI002269CFF8|nr:NfeD family protein [Snodgrassella sp. B3882]MCX8744984.1 NfeD family protein [Snodgrassella sp. B3882]